MMLSSNFENNLNPSISYSIEGKKKNDMCLFFLNGMFRGKESWIKLIRNKKLQEYKMIFMDYPGFGNAFLPNNDYDYMSLVANNMVSIIENEKEEKINLIGYSIGGVFACWFASLYPEKIRSLILINSGFILSAWMKVIIQQSLKLLSTVDDFSIIYPFIYVWQYSEDYLEKIAGWEGYRRSGGNEYVKNKRALEDLMIITDQLNSYKDCVEKIKCPTLVIGSKQDMVFPIGRQHELFQNKKIFELKIIPDAAHSTIVENYSEINRNLGEFLYKYET